jgi:hypothetical protein
VASPAAGQPWTASAEGLRLSVRLTPRGEEVEVLARDVLAAIDRFGARRAIVVFAAICVVAAAVSASATGFTSLAGGRFLLGMGAEPLIVAVTAVLAKWFKGKELSFAFGLNLSI